MVRRRKPASWLRYWGGGSPSETAADGFRTVLVYCVGPPEPGRCWHVGELKLADLPDCDWYDISARLRCTKCGSVGYVDTRLNWSEVIDFNKPSNP